MAILQSKPGSTTINTGGGAYIGGNVTTSTGDFIGRDKFTVSGKGNVVVNNDTSGSPLSDDKNALQEETITKILNLLTEITEMLPDSKLSSDDIDEVNLDILKLNEQFSKPEPNGRIILKRIESTSEFINDSVVTKTMPSLVECIDRVFMMSRSLYVQE